MRDRLRKLLCGFGVVIGSCSTAFGESVTVNAERLNLRAEPSTSSAVVATVTRGTLLEVLGREGDWYRVSVPGTGNAAYVHSFLVTAGRPGSGEPSTRSPDPEAPSAVPPPRLGSPPPTAAPRNPAEPAKRPQGAPAARPAPITPSDARTRFGAHGAFADILGLGIGGRLHVVPSSSILDGRLRGLASFDYYFNAGPSIEVDVPGGLDVSTRFWEIMAGPVFAFSSSGNAHPYVGVGLRISHGSFEVSDFTGSASVSGSRFGIAAFGGVVLREHIVIEGRFGQEFGAAIGLLF